MHTKIHHNFLKIAQNVSNTIHRIENGSIPEIGIRKIIAICDALGLELLAQKKAKHPALQQLLKEQRDA